MKLPNIKNKRAVYVESREAYVVFVEDIYYKGDLIELVIKADVSIPHIRT